MRRRSLSCAALVAALLAGCGSTVQMRQTAPGLAGGDGLSVPAEAQIVGGQPDTNPGGALGSTGGTTGSDLPGSASGETAAPRSPSADAGTSTTTTGSTTVGPPSGRGFTKTTISLGVATADDFNGFASSAGLGAAGYDGDPNAWFKAAADDINKRGGLLGRKVVLVKHNYNSAQTLNDTASANQAACVTWTQDRPVAAVLFAGFLVEDTLLSCLNKAGVPLIYPGASLDYPLHYRQTYDRFPLFFNLAQMVGERFDRLAIGRLADRGFFSPWNTRTGGPGSATTATRVGIVGFDDPDGALQVASQKKELARHGIKSVEVVRCPRSLSAKLSCSQSTVLRFATNGVTHVFGAGTVFMQNAESQGYYPRYFVHVSAANFAAIAPATQLRGAMGEGYIPVNDVAASEYPGDPTPAATSCKALMKKAGQATTNTNSLVLQMSVCDEFFFLEAAVKRAGALGPQAVRTGLETLGSSQASALTWISALSPSDHTSARALRDLEYRSDLKRFVYVSRTNHTDA